MKIPSIACVLLLVPGTALAQNPSQGVVGQYSTGGQTGSYSYRRDAVGLCSAHVTPTMHRQAGTRALALRERVALWIEQDGGTLSSDHQRDVSKEYYAIRSLLGFRQISGM